MPRPIRPALASLLLVVVGLGATGVTASPALAESRRRPRIRSSTPAAGSSRRCRSWVTPCCCHPASNGSRMTPLPRSRRARASSTVTRRPVPRCPPLRSGSPTTAACSMAWACGPSTRRRCSSWASWPASRTGSAPPSCAGIVEQTVAERASDMADPVIQAISVPAGSGFLAVYLDATDLAQHQEIHLRTPTGRYLILATSYPGIADPDARGDGAGHRRVAAAPSLARPLTCPIRARPPTAPPIPRSRRRSRTTSAGSTLTRRSLAGESLVSSTRHRRPAPSRASSGRLVAAPGDVTRRPRRADRRRRAAAHRRATGSHGVTPEAAQAFVDSFPDDIWSDARVAGHDVAGQRRR